MSLEGHCGYGSQIRTDDLQAVSLTSYRAATAHEREWAVCTPRAMGEFSQDIMG